MDVEMSRAIIRFLETYAWLWRFSNVKIMLKCHQWPSKWHQFIVTTKVGYLKQILCGNFGDCPDFVRDFVKTREAIVKKFEAMYVTDYENDRYHVQMCKSDVKRGMSAKKIHEVERFGSFIANLHPSSSSGIVDVGSGAYKYLGIRNLRLVSETILEFLAREASL